MKNYRWIIFHIVMTVLIMLLFITINYVIIKQINTVSYLYENEMWVELISYLTKSYRG